MTNPIGIHSNAEDVQTIAVEANELHGSIMAANLTNLERARKIGELLLKAKKHLGHGNWLPWVKKNLRFSDQTARNYMKVAECWEEVTKSVKLDTLPDSVSGFLALLAGEDEQPSTVQNGQSAPTRRTTREGAQAPAEEEPTPTLSPIDVLRDFIKKLKDEGKWATVRKMTVEDFIALLESES